MNTIPELVEMCDTRAVGVPSESQLVKGAYLMNNNGAECLKESVCEVRKHNNETAKSFADMDTLIYCEENLRSVSPIFIYEMDRE
jgi:hypothetical protein